MPSGRLGAVRRWVVRERVAFVPAVVGVLILSLVIVTRGEQTAWLMWIALPLMMLSLGYFAVISLLSVLYGKGEDR